MACDPNTLLANANCIEQCLMEGQMNAIETYLYCQIAAGGGGGGMHFRILTEGGDFINTESGDRLRTE